MGFSFISEGDPSRVAWAVSGKKRVKVWRGAPLCLFWTVWRERKRVAFENEDLSIQMMKFSFVSNLWFWSKCCIVDGPNSLFNFFVWVGYRRGWVSFLYPSSFCF